MSKKERPIPAHPLEVGLRRRGFAFGAFATAAALPLVRVATAQEAPPPFPTMVEFTFKGRGTTGTALLSYDVKGNRLALSGFEGMGVKSSDVMESNFASGDLSLEQGVIYDEQKPRPFKQSMVRRKGGGLLDPEGFIYDYTRSTEAGTTSTELDSRFTVVDFLTMFVVAADYVRRGENTARNLSILRDRSLQHVVLTRGSEADFGGQKAVEVKLTAPGDAKGGFRYFIAEQNGLYVPVKFTVPGQGIEMTGQMIK